MNNQDDKYKDLEDEVYNILLSEEDQLYFPDLFHNVENNSLHQVYKEGLKPVSLLDAIEIFGVEAVGECVEINLQHKQLSSLLDEMAELD